MFIEWSPQQKQDVQKWASHLLAAAEEGWSPKYHSSVYFSVYKQEFFMTKYDILTLLHKIICETVELILN